MDEIKRKINVNSFKSIYIDVCYDKTKIASATGFLVNKDNLIYLITNRHVVTGRHNETNECLDKNSAIPNKLNIWFPHRIEGGFEWTGIDIKLYDDNNVKRWLEHPKYKEKVDVVAILIGTYDQFIFCYNLKSNYDPIITENVFILGYPYGIDVNPNEGKYAVWSKGTVASDPELNLVINDEELPAFLIDARTRQGQSGSPVIYYSANGVDRQSDGIAIYGGPILHEIGIYSGRINKESDLGYVWKWSLIEEIINQ